MTPIVSVIMPCLNVAAYIKKSILSVVSQSCFPDLEVLIVDAGSSDGTREVAASYADQYDNVYLIDSKIRSYGYQVNLAIELARGEYIGILDTDDFLEPDAYEILYQIAITEKCDVVKGGKYSFYEDSVLGEMGKQLFGSKIVERYFGRKLSVEEHSQLFSIDWNIWNGIYRTDIFKSIKLSETSGAAFQDIGGLFRLLYKSKTCYLTDKLVYHYRIDNENSSSYNSNVFKYALYEYGELLREFSDVADSWKESIYVRMAHHVVGLLNQAVERGTDYETIRADVEQLRELLKKGVAERFITETNTSDIWSEVQRILSDAKEYYEKHGTQYKQEERRLRECILISQQYPVVIFGCGLYGQFVASVIKKHYLYKTSKTDCTELDLLFADNAEEKHGTMVEGVSVMGLTEAREVFPSAKYIIAVKYHEDEIKKQLLEVGIDSHDILIYTDHTSWIIPLFDDV